jgi:hypothetical protein
MPEKIILPLVRDLSPEKKEEYLNEVDRCGQFKRQDVSDTDLFGSHFPFDASEKGEEYWFDLWSELTGGLILNIDDDVILTAGPQATLPAISKEQTITDIDKMVLYRDGDLKEVIFDLKEAKIEVIDSGKTLTINLK